MKPLNEFKQKISVLFTDIDDTMTSHGRLPSQSYQALWNLHKQDIAVIPVTGRPAGWCEMIARMWPVAGVIGENGALAFEYSKGQMKRFFAVDEKTRQSNQLKLDKIKQEVLQNIPGSALASDQFCRLFDLAIDFCEDVSPLPESEVKKIVSIFEKHGATAKVSSIHVNGWFGDYDKRSMCEIFYKQKFAKDLKEEQNACTFIGDSPNDEPLFAFFDHSVAVANIVKFKEVLHHQPQYVTKKPGAEGFVELAEKILEI